MRDPRTTGRGVSRTLALAAACLALAGCTAVRAPRVEHVGVRELERTDSRAVYAFRFRATNPNRDPLPLGEVRYTVFMDGRAVFSGVRSPETTLGTYADREFEVPAVLDTGSVNLSGIVDYRVDGALTYIPPGRFGQELYRSNVHVPTVEFRAPGRVDTDASPQRGEDP